MTHILEILYSSRFLALCHCLIQIVILLPSVNVSFRKHHNNYFHHLQVGSVLFRWVLVMMINVLKMTLLHGMQDLCCLSIIANNTIMLPAS